MIFHLAIPSGDLDKSLWFYKFLGAKIGREYTTHFVMNFYGHQVVCHLSSEWDRSPKMYPRHFGIIMQDLGSLMHIVDLHSQESFVFEKYFIRHKGKREEHHTFFLKDPFNNLIEFKWYRHGSAIFG